MVNVRQKVFLLRVLINQLVVLFYLKEFHFHLVLLFSTRSDLSLIPSFPRTCCSLIPCGDAYLLLWQLRVPPASVLFAFGLELLWTNTAPGTISITAYKIEKREEQLGDSRVVLLNTNACFPVSANVTLHSVSEENLGFLKLWLCLLCNQIMYKKA